MTEMITGLDLIQEQVRAAQGEVLRWKQEDIKIKVPGQSLSDTLPEDCQAMVANVASGRSCKDLSMQRCDTCTLDIPPGSVLGLDSLLPADLREPV